MNPKELAAFLSQKGFSVKQVPLANAVGILGKDGVNTFDLTSNFCDKYIGSKFWTCGLCSKTFDTQTALHNHFRAEHYGATSEDEIAPADDIKFEPSENEETSYIIIKTAPDQDPLDFRRRRPRRIETRPRKPYERKLVGTNCPTEVAGPFTCNICGEFFDECCNFSMHVNSVHFKRRRLILRCQICEKRFGGKNFVDVEAPYEQATASPSPSCDVCGRTFALQAHLDHHRKRYHSKIKPYECSLCNKSFTQVTGLSQHMKTHSGIRPFACNVCTKTFRQKAGLDQHMRIHSKVKPYNCLLCSRAFTQSAHLSQHMRIHTKIEPFECGLCSRRFKQSSHLNFHLRSHETGTDQYVRGDSGVTITALDPLTTGEDVSDQ